MSSISSDPSNSCKVSQKIIVILLCYLYGVFSMLRPINLTMSPICQDKTFTQEIKIYFFSFFIFTVIDFVLHLLLLILEITRVIDPLCNRYVSQQIAKIFLLYFAQVLRCDMMACELMSLICNGRIFAQEMKTYLPSFTIFSVCKIYIKR